MIISIILVSIILLLVLTEKVNLKIKLAPPVKYEINFVFFGMIFEYSKKDLKKNKRKKKFKFSKFFSFKEKIIPISKALLYLIKRGTVSSSDDDNYDIKLVFFFYNLIFSLAVMLYFKLKAKIKRGIKNVG